MFGKRIRLYYRGIVKICTNSFGPHARKSCNQEKVSWLIYVNDLMKARPEIPEEFYGKWANLVQEVQESRDSPIENVRTVAPISDETPIPIMSNITSSETNEQEHSQRGVKNLKSSPAKMPQIQTQDRVMEHVLSKLRGQGLTISTSAAIPQQEDHLIDSISMRTKIKRTNEQGRGRGRRKTSLN